MQRVEVVEGRGWAGGPYGSKDSGDRFDYDLKNDPHKLGALGLVKAVRVRPPAKSAAAKRKAKPAAKAGSAKSPAKAGE